MIGDGEFSEDSSTVGWFRHGESTFPGSRFDLPVAKLPDSSVNLKSFTGGTGMLCFLIFLQEFVSFRFVEQNVD
jgi:hypothetical protein